VRKVAKLKLEDGSEVEAFTADEVRAQIEKETGGLKSKLEELLGETKTAKQKAKELEELQQQEAEARAKEKGEFKELYEKTQLELRAERDARQKERHETIKEKTERAASEIASELTRDTKRAELLRKEISQFAKYTDEGVKFEMGGVEVDRAKVMTHISDNYPFLIDGSGASGGGASGSKSNGGAVKKFNEYTGAELSAIRKDNPAEYERLKTAYHGT
jgi:DNA repair exonuclease SbcCD ATPase subunit